MGKFLFVGEPNVRGLLSVSECRNFKKSNDYTLYFESTKNTIT